MKKYLVVSGDSFTKGHKLGEVASWAYHVAKKMNLQLINLSQNGMGNEWISSNLLSFLYRHESILNQCVVMVGWSDFLREFSTYKDPYFEESYTDLITIVPGDLQDIPHDESYTSNILNKHSKSLIYFFGNELVCLYKTYFSILHVKNVLNINNIPFLFFDSVSDNKLYKSDKGYFIDSNESTKIYLDFNKIDIEFIKDLKDNSFLNKIFDKNYINFEGLPIYRWLLKEGNNIYSEGNDGHTNQLGADYISNMIIKEYDKLYN